MTLAGRPTVQKSVQHTIAGWFCQGFCFKRSPLQLKKEYYREIVSREAAHVTRKGQVKRSDGGGSTGRAKFVASLSSVAT